MHRAAPVPLPPGAAPLHPTAIGDGSPRTLTPSCEDTSPPLKDQEVTQEGS